MSGDTSATVLRVEWRATGGWHQSGVGRRLNLPLWEGPGAVAPRHGGDTPEEAEATGLPAVGPMGVWGQLAKPLPLEPRPHCAPQIWAVRGMGTPSSYTHATLLLVTARIWLFHVTPRPGRGMGAQVMRAWHPPLTLFPALQDLSSPSQYDTGVALTGLSCFVTPDLARDLANDIMTLVSVPLLCEGIWKSRARGGPRLSVMQDPPGVRQWAGVPGGSRGTHSAASPPSASFSHFSFISFETVLFGGGVGVAGGRGLAEDAQPRGQAHDLSGTVLLKLK